VPLDQRRADRQRDFVGQYRFADASSPLTSGGRRSVTAADRDLEIVGRD
jgi:hypothetical protein